MTLVPTGMGQPFALTGAPNARDLGGYPTSDGRTVAYGKVFRSGALCAITDRDLVRLDDVNLAHVIDLRGAGEVEILGQDRVPAGGCAHTGLPVFDPELAVYALLGGTLRADQANLLLANGSGRGLMVQLYRGFVRSPGARAQFGSALRLLADQRQLPVLFHCTAGKDRAGWLAAVLLTILGVARDDVIADYELTNERLGVQVQAAVATLCAKQGIHDTALLRPLLAADREYLAGAFTDAEESFGSFDRFVAVGLSVDDLARRRLRDNLLC